MRAAAGLTLLFIGCLLLAADAVSLGISQTMSLINPQLAIALRPWSGPIAAAAAERRMAAGDAPGARASALSALTREPNNVPGLRTLAMAEERLGRRPSAVRLMRLAGRLSWRDGVTQTWLLQDSLMTGDGADLVLRADSLLRRAEDSDASPVSALLVTGIQLIPGLATPLASRLELSPPWRTRFLMRAGATPGVEESTRRLLGLLRRSQTPPTAQEVTPLISHEVAMGRFVEARTDWAALSPLARQDDRGPLQDGQFRGRSDGSPFTWSWEDSVGASQDRIAAPGMVSGMMALSVTYDGYSTPDLARQLLVMPPGSHVLTWRERVETGDGERLGWEVACAPAGPVLARSAPQSGPAGVWRTRQMSFVVPATGCAGAWLRLVAAPAERRGDHQMLFTDLSLSTAGQGGSGAAGAGPP